MKTTVMAMQVALTLKEVSPAPATLATLVYTLATKSDPLENDYQA